MNGDVTVIRDYWNLVSWLDGKLGAEGTAAGLLILGGAVLLAVALLIRARFLSRKKSG